MDDTQRIERQRTQLRLCWFVIILAALSVGCRSTKPPGEAKTSRNHAPDSSGISKVELAEKLAAFYTEFVNSAEAATSEAVARTTNVLLRTRLLEARIRAVRSCRQAVFQREPMAAFVDTWNLCIQLKSFLASDEGREAFGDAQPGMLQAAEILRGDIAGLGKLFLQPDDLQELEQKLNGFAHDHPFSMQRDIAPASREGVSSIPQLSWVLKLPLSPFHALEGVDQTAQAVSELTFVAGGFSQSVSDMPRELSWQSELLLIQARREIAGLMAEMDANLTNTQSTLQNAGQTLANTERALKAATEMSVAVDGTLKTYTQMMKELFPEKPKETTPAEPPGRPFDILDYARTAEQITATMEATRRVLIEFQNTVQTNAITERTKELQNSTRATILDTEASGRRLADHVTLRVIWCVAFFFISLFLYRFAVSRMNKPATAPPPSKAG
jgi:hypothetical protein